LDPRILSKGFYAFPFQFPLICPLLQVQRGVMAEKEKICFSRMNLCMLRREQFQLTIKLQREHQHLGVMRMAQRIQQPEFDGNDGQLSLQDDCGVEEPLARQNSRERSNEVWKKVQTTETLG
jgi:hypothetical protein